MSNEQVLDEVQLNNVSGGLKQDTIECDGVIVKKIQNGMFNVELDNNDVILAQISGKMRMNYIRLDEGDRVTVEISPYDSKKGRIIKRIKV